MPFACTLGLRRTSITRVSRYHRFPDATRRHPNLFFAEWTGEIIEEVEVVAVVEEVVVGLNLVVVGAAVETMKMLILKAQMQWR